MRKLILLIIIVIIVVFPANVKATTATKAPGSSPAPTEEGLSQKLDEQINQLKEKIASRVAELNLVEKRGITGDISEVSGNKITLKDIYGKTRFIDVDEITKFSSPSAKASFGLSDLKKGAKINVLGLYNKQSKRVLARFINTAVNPVIVSGNISDIDSDNFVITVISEDKKQRRIDVETTTKISVYNEEDGLVRYGFSRIELGDRVIVNGYPDKVDPSLISASRIIDFPDLPNNPKIIIPQPTDSEAEGTPAPTVRITVTPTR